MKFHATEDKVDLLGRTLFLDNVRYLSHSCSGIAFTAVATKIVIRLWSDGYKMPNTERAFVAVFINDEEIPHNRLRLVDEEIDYCIFESEKLQEVKVRLVKYSEDAFAAVGVKSIEVEGELLPKQEDKTRRKLLFIGDSITCGYGNEGVYEKDEFTTEQENPWGAYAATAARRLDCDYHLVSRSGIGIYSSWTPTEQINDEILMPEIYPYTDFELMRRYGGRFCEKWDPKRFQPDAIIINLGTNDESYTKEIPERINCFGKAYRSFLEQVRADYKESYIFCILGVMGDILYPEIERQVKLWQKEKNDLKITTLLLPRQEDEDGLGTDWHPSFKTHSKVADRLCLAVKEKLKW